MRYCHNCGNALNDGDRFCQSCGAKVEIENMASGTERPVEPEMPKDNENKSEKKKNSELKTIIKILMIIVTVCSGFAIIPLCWTIPMTVSYSRKIEKGEDVSLAFKICTLLFMNMIIGILMLVDDDE